jgi:hypothetical protein
MITDTRGKLSSHTFSNVFTSLKRISDDEGAGNTLTAQVYLPLIPSPSCSAKEMDNMIIFLAEIFFLERRPFAFRNQP